MSTTPTLRDRFRDTHISRFLQALWRLVFAALVCAAIIVPLPEQYFSLPSRFLIGWDAGVVLYLVLVAIMVLHSDHEQVRRYAPLQDEGRFTILIVIAGLASLGAIFLWLRTAAEDESIQLSILALLFLTTLLSWVFVHMMFALHYAHEYYAEHRGQGGGLHFLGDRPPNYWDFIYFAFTIGTSFAVSDVSVTSRSIRQTVTAHMIVGFIFNVTMIALTVSIAGDAITAK